MEEAVPKDARWRGLRGDAPLGLAGLCLIGATFLPWVRSDTEGLFSGLSGMDFPGGRLLLVACAVLVVLSLVGKRVTWLALSVAALSLGIGSLALLLIGKQNREREMFGHTEVGLDVGVGLWVLFAIAAAVLLGLWLGRKRAQTAS